MSRRRLAPIERDVARHPQQDARRGFRADDRRKRFHGLAIVPLRPPQPLASAETPATHRRCRPCLPAACGSAACALAACARGSCAASTTPGVMTRKARTRLARRFIPTSWQARCRCRNRWPRISVGPRTVRWEAMTARRETRPAPSRAGSLAARNPQTCVTFERWRLTRPNGPALALVTWSSQSQGFVLQSNRGIA